MIDAISNAIRDALEVLREKDGMLFDCPIEVEAEYDARKLHEVCINHRMAMHLENEIIPLLDDNEEYFADIEFNREGINFKEIAIAGQKRRVRPDIIIHNRKSGDDKKNILVVECKKRGADEVEIEFDIKKIESFITTPEYSYQFGLQIIYGSDGIEGKLIFLQNNELRLQPVEC